MCDAIDIVKRRRWVRCKRRSVVNIHQNITTRRSYPDTESVIVNLCPFHHRKMNRSLRRHKMMRTVTGYIHRLDPNDWIRRVTMVSPIVHTDPSTHIVCYTAIWMVELNDRFTSTLDIMQP